ncbi:MAG: type II secretion system F family protein [Lachnospiraceae bacterium]|nr:type II secretion system F family protein [Lachnospiraceae bacterium]
MADFGYEAITKDGKTLKGSIEAETIDAAQALLKAKGYIVTDISEQSLLNKDINISFDKKPSPRDLAVFCNQFVAMSRAGVSILECLNLLREQTENKSLARAIRETQAEVEKGETLADGLSNHPKVFNNLMITTINAGEQSGSLDISLERMAEQYEKSAKTAALIKKAMIYPIVVAIVAVAVVVVMLVKVIPAYTDMFDDLGTDLPAITKAVVAMSDFLMNFWFIVVPVVVGIVVGIKAYVATPSGQRLKSTLALKIKMTQNLTTKSACSQLARTLATLLSAGVPLVEAVDIAGNTMQNVLFKEAVMYAKDEVIKGVPLSQPLEESGLFPPMMYHMVRIGEEAGNTEEMLTKLADYYDEEVEIAVQGLMAAMEPMIIIVLAAVVGVLIAAVMSPMLTMYQSLDNM